MYVRFKTSFVDNYHEHRYGVFQAASFLLHSEIMCPYEKLWLDELWLWFCCNLSVPSVYSQKKVNNDVICWFKPTAKEHLQKMYEMTIILGQYGLAISQARCRKPGYIVYEDDDQVAVIPFAESRKWVR